MRSGGAGPHLNDRVHNFRHVADDDVEVMSRRGSPRQCGGQWIRQDGKVLQSSHYREKDGHIQDPCPAVISLHWATEKPHIHNQRNWHEDVCQSLQPAQAALIGNSLMEAQSVAAKVE